jgi:hypothetical protein
VNTSPSYSVPLKQVQEKRFYLTWCLILSRASRPLRLRYPMKTYVVQPAPHLRHLNNPRQQLCPCPGHLPQCQRLLRCQFPARYGPFLSLLSFAHGLTDAQLPPRRAPQNLAAPSPGPADAAAIVAATPTPLPPLAPVQGDATFSGTQLPTVRIYPIILVESRNLTRSPS